MPAPELESISIHGFKSISKLEKLELRPVNIVIGPNGSGKSNFIGAFSFLNAIRQGRLQHYVQQSGGANSVLNFGAKFTRELLLRVSFRGGVNGYEIRLVPNAQDELIPEGETVYFRGPGYDRPYGKTVEPNGKEAGIGIADIKIANYVRHHLDQWRLYHFHDTSSSSPMKRTGDLLDNRFLRPDGANLAAFLYLLRENHKQSYDQIVKTIRLVAPFFDDFVLEPQKLNENKIRLEWRHTHSDAYFDAASLSDGTLRFMALSVLFLQPEPLRPSVILVDEPELGLHPYAINLLASLIRQASLRTQAILSTQSSILLDEFDPEDVLVASVIEGNTKFRRLSSEELGTWLEDYTLGQLWEKNEFGGRPQSG